MSNIRLDCAPGRVYNNGSCLYKDELQSIIIEYNKQKKNYNNLKDTLSLSKNALIENVNDIMKEYECSDNDQICWVGTKLVKKINNGEISGSVFKPIAPEGKYEWLSTTNINQVLEQYTNKHPDFEFYGALPYDFDILDELEINNINFKDLANKNKTKMGIVLNLDNHDENGSHWVAIYSELDKNRIYYFDSFGKKPGKRIRNFSNKLLKFMHSNNTNGNFNTKDFLKKYKSSHMYDIRYNKTQHQFKNSECGVYSMNFLIRLLNGEDFDSIVDNITNDDDMNKCRNIYFQNVNI